MGSSLSLIKSNTANMEQSNLLNSKSLEAEGTLN